MLTGPARCWERKTNSLTAARARASERTRSSKRPLSCSWLMEEAAMQKASTTMTMSSENVWPKLTRTPSGL